MYPTARQLFDEMPKPNSYHKPSQEPHETKKQRRTIPEFLLFRRSGEENLSSSHEIKLIEVSIRVMMS
ncbi:hypothetical protein Hanom_Chr09g00829761 [Helianthus anomalus]